MNIQRLRNLTTGYLHTKMSDVYEDIEYLTSSPGIMTHQIPNAMEALLPWLQKQLPEDRFWNDKYDPDHTGDVDIQPMEDIDRLEFFVRFTKLPSPFFPTSGDDQ